MTQTVSAPAAPAGPPQYEPLDFFVVRAPLLPVEAYRDLSRATQEARAGAESGPKAWLARDDIRRALAVGSETLLTAAGAAKNGSRQSKIDAKLLRYLIRMSTRPTPFGLFAGVALGRWNGRTTLALAAGPRTQRTRPDMEWLLRVVLQLEALPEVRRRLRLIANPAALEAGGRVHLAERISRGETVAPPAVSIRATGIVRRALDAARTPVPFEQLASTLLEETPGATTERIEQLLTELWEQTLLLTDLRPPLAVESPIEHVIQCLEGVPAAARVRERLRDLSRAAAAWDGAPPEAGVERFRAMAADAGTLAPLGRSPFQVDSAVGLVDNGLSRRVGEEAARAVALLLRLSPAPRGPAYLIAYRRLFAQRYGAHREVPVLQLLDPNFGLGPPAIHGPLSAGGLGIAPARWARRNDALMELATHALRDRRRSVDLDDEMIERLETWDGSALPPSVDLYVSVSATSRDALDAGEFHVVVGPNVGSLAAGRGLGRFTDLLAGARDALRRAAEAEEARAPQHLWAELTYQPRHLRLGNVSIRPNVRAHEIPVGVSAGPDSMHVVPLGELVVGVRDERFYVRWPAAGRDVTITAGHMLSPVRAPAVCRFLSEIGRDGCCQLAGFGWGPAAGFPFLPRVQVGRIVLSLAQWRLTGGTLPEAGRGQQTFEHALARWRTRWRVPSHVYLSAGDNRLLLDLCDGSQADQLRRALRQLRGHGTLMLTEVFPDLEHAWVEDAAGRHFVTEFVLPLVRRAPAAPRPAPVVRRAVDETRFSGEPRQTGYGQWVCCHHWPQVVTTPLPGVHWEVAVPYPQQQYVSQVR